MKLENRNVRSVSVKELLQEPPQRSIAELNKPMDVLLFILKINYFSFSAARRGHCASNKK
jgi:hypothetical protein